MIPVLWLEPSRMWDCFFLEQLLNNELWNPVNGYKFERYDNIDSLPSDTKGLILIIPGRYWTERVSEINKMIAKFDWILICNVSDEESVFPVDKIEHKNKKVYFQTPRLGQTDGIDRCLPLGYPPHIDQLQNYSQQALERPYDVFLSAQNTHVRRKQCFEKLNEISATEKYSFYINETDGFTKGLEPSTYMEYLAGSKIVPAPSGAITPESFRAYEALEAGCIPILDNISPVYNSEGYWAQILGSSPIPVINDWASLPGYIEELLVAYPANVNRMGAWWLAFKRQWSYNLKSDLDALIGTDNKGTELKDLITVTVVTSPIPSNPSTEIIEATIDSIRYHLKDCEIIICCDGVREEQEDRRESYELFLQSLIWKATHEWQNVVVKIFDDHKHQSGMAKETMPDIATPLLLYVEGDCPLTVGEDRQIDWKGICSVILDGHFNHIRLSHEASILKEHKHLMLSKKPELYGDLPLVRTIQYSQRPAIASKAFYMQMLDNYFPPNSKTMIEDLIYGKVIDDYNKHGITGYYNWRLGIYAPDGSMQRSLHLDGRGTDPKFSMNFGSWE